MRPTFPFPQIRGNQRALSKYDEFLFERTKNNTFRNPATTTNACSLRKVFSIIMIYHDDYVYCCCHDSYCFWCCCSYRSFFIVISGLAGGPRCVEGGSLLLLFGLGGGFDMFQQHFCHVYRIAGLSSCVCVAAATEFECQIVQGFSMTVPPKLILFPKKNRGFALDDGINSWEKSPDFDGEISSNMVYFRIYMVYITITYYNYNIYPYTSFQLYSWFNSYMDYTIVE